ncbi:GNAT family N-acetyltransferase [uncultured Sphingomonas sp.]|uniref:GNAT family N-acetyltransferase n=1 Tax=uncultured Sphingomonas sp. TaxID=158754 RepID=UPI0035CC2F73
MRLNGVVQDLHARLRPDIFRSNWNYSHLEKFWTDRLNDPNSTVAVAAFDSSLLGYIWFEIQTREQDTFYLPRRRIYIHHIAVDENARSKGVGTKLLDQAESEAVRLGIANVVLDAWALNSIAQGFFGSRGYDPVNIVRSKIVAIG